MLRKHAILLSPAAVEGGEVETQQQRPDSMGSWMGGLKTAMEAAPTPPTKPAETETPKPNGPSGQDNPHPVGGDPGKATPPAEQPKPAAEKAPEQPQPEEAKWPRTADDWKKWKAARAESETKFKAEIAERETKLSELTKQLEEVKSAAAKAAEKPVADPAELDSLKKQVEQYSERLRLIDVEKHPKFQAYFEGKVNQQLELAKAILGDERAAAFANAVKLPNTPEFAAIRKERINEVVADLDVLDASQIGGVLKALAEIEVERKSEIAKARENYEKMQKEQTDAAATQRQSMEKLWKQTIAEVTDAKGGMAIFQKREGDAAWNSGVETRLKRAEALLLNNDIKPAELFKAALHAAAFPDVLKSWKDEVSARDGEIAKLQAQVKELTAAQPAGGGGTPPNEIPQPVEIKQGMRPFDAAQAWVKRLGQQQ